MEVKRYHKKMTRRLRKALDKCKVMEAKPFACCSFGTVLAFGTFVSFWHPAI